MIKKITRQICNPYIIIPTKRMMLVLDIHFNKFVQVFFLIMKGEIGILLVN